MGSVRNGCKSRQEWSPRAVQDLDLSTWHITKNPLATAAIGVRSTISTVAKLDMVVSLFLRRWLGLLEIFSYEWELLQTETPLDIY